MSTQKNEHNPEPELNPCPVCGSPEIEADTPRTVYACGSSDYDQRPNTFKQSKTCKPIGSRNRRITPPTDTTGPVATLRGAIGVISELVRIIEKLSSTKDGKTLWECSPIKDQECYEAFLELNRIVGGAKALRTCYHLEQILLTDTTGSGREGETPETDAFEYESSSKIPGNGNGDMGDALEHATRVADFARQLERQRDAALKELSTISAVRQGEWKAMDELRAQVEALRRDGERVKEELRHWHSVANDFANRRNQAEISAADLREELESKLDKEQGKRDKLQRHFAVTERRLLEELEVEREALRAAGAVCARFERERSEAEKRIKELEAELQRTARFLESQADSPRFNPRQRAGFRAAAECARNAISDR